MRNRLLVASAAMPRESDDPYAEMRARACDQGGPPAPAVPKLAIGKTMFWPGADIEARWKENEARKRNNSRLFDGPTNISANVRIVRGEKIRRSSTKRPRTSGS
jgi:hypothetical protein